jgi:iron complex transport system substrate-binding protein
MEWQEIIRLWNKTPVRVMDIRHIIMQPGERVDAYSLPSSAFLLTNQGEARVQLENIELSSANSQVLYSGKKGAHLSITCLNRPFDYYLVLFKPLIEQPRLLREPYAFQASHPLALITILDRVYQQWRNEEEIDRLLVTGLFYQFVHEQFRQLQRSEEQVEEPELAEQMARYIHEHFGQNISMETMAHLFHYSTHHLARVFKRKYGCSPIDYVIQTRILRAKALLVDTGLPIREVAENVGYKDLYYFSRLFKKVTGETPAQFKMHSPPIKSSNHTNDMPESFIAPVTGERYIDNGDNHYQYDTWRVNDLDFKFRPSFAVTLLFSLSLLLAACGGVQTSVQPVETRMYTDGFGRQVEIPKQPQKAVVLTYGGYLLPLGLKPVGVNQETLNQYPEEMSGVQSIGEGKGNLEAISALDPDLIILPDYFDQGLIENYEKIAPTVAVAWGGDPDVVNTLRTVGDIMDKKPEAEAWIAKFDEKLQGIRDHSNITIAPGTTAISFILYKGEVLLGGEGGTLGKLIYEDFGFKMPEQFKPFADGGTVLSLEKLVDKPADYFFTQMTDEELGEMMELFKEPVYQAIPAVKNNRVINVSRDKWNNGPYTVDSGVDALIEQVSKLQDLK